MALSAYGLAGYNAPTIAPPVVAPKPNVLLPAPPTRLGTSGYAAGSSGYAPGGTTAANWPYGLPGTTGPYGTIGSNGLPIYGLGAGGALTPGQSPITTNAGAPGAPGAAGDTTNPFTTLHNVKSPEQQALIDQAAKTYTAGSAATTNALAEFSKNYLAGTPAAAANTAQENAVVSGVYSGANDAARAALRDEAAAADKAATNLGLDYWRRGQSSTDLTSSSNPTNSSYGIRLGMGVAVDAQTKLAMRLAAQKRADYEKSLADQIAFRNLRTNANDVLAGRSLVPIEAQQRLTGEQLRQLGLIGQMDLSNNFYGLKAPYDPNTVYGGDFSYSAGQGRFGGQPAGGGRPGGGPPAGAPFGQSPTIAPNGYGLYSNSPGGGFPGGIDPSKFPAGGYRDGYGRWMVLDPATGTFSPQQPNYQFDPGWTGYAPGTGPTPEPPYYLGAGDGTTPPYYDPTTDIGLT